MQQKITNRLADILHILGFTYTPQSMLENGVSNHLISLGIAPTSIVLTANGKFILV
jgi:hypothetical protein